MYNNALDVAVCWCNCWKRRIVTVTLRVSVNLTLRIKLYVIPLIVLFSGVNVVCLEVLLYNYKTVCLCFFPVGTNKVLWCTGGVSGSGLLVRLFGE